MKAYILQQLTPNNEIDVLGVFFSRDLAEITYFKTAAVCEDVELDEFELSDNARQNILEAIENGLTCVYHNVKM